MSTRGWAAAPAIFVISIGALPPAGAQEKLPPLRTGVDGTFAPHAFPKLDGGIQGYVDLFIESPSRCAVRSQSIR
jgi:polar amino acid transport system substrate-binding protein